MAAIKINLPTPQLPDETQNLLTFIAEIAALPELGNLEKIWELCDTEKKAQFLRLLFGEGLQKTNTGYRTPYLIQCLLHNAHKVSALEIKSGTENANFDASGSVCSPYGAKIEPADHGLFALVGFLCKLKAA